MISMSVISRVLDGYRHARHSWSQRERVADPSASAHLEPLEPRLMLAADAVVSMVATAPVIDGVTDAAWDSAVAQSLDLSTIGSSNVAAEWKSVWDADNLYVMVTVTDDDLTHDDDPAGWWWEDDAVEIFIDGDNSKGTAYDGIDDFQFGFRWNDPGVVYLGQNSVQDSTGIVYAMQDTVDGYVIEVAMPWTTLIGSTPSAGTELGFETQVDDDENGGMRDAQIAWHATDELAWTRPDRFGTIELASDITNQPVLAGIESATLVYTEGDGNVDITDAVTVTDPDDTHIENAVIQIVGNYQSGEDTLAFTNTADITGSWNSTTGSLTLTGSDTLANYQDALRNVSYSNTSGDPITLTRTIAFKVNDGDNDSNTVSRDLDVISVNVAPVNAVPGDQTTSQDTTIVFSSATGNPIAVSDADAGAEPVRVTLTAANGTMTLAGLTGLTFNTGDGTADAVMTFTGSITDINSALDGLQFAPTPGYTGDASIEIVTNDQGNTGSAISDTIDATQDTWVDSSAATANYDANIDLGVETGTRNRISYLDFTISGYAGRIITSATLELTERDGSSESDADFDVREITSAWDETTVTWNTRPTHGTSALGSYTDGLTTNEETIEIALDETHFSGDGTYGLALVATVSGNDHKFYSENGAAPPQLVLTYLETETDTDTVNISVTGETLQAPANLAATPGDARITLTWDANPEPSVLYYKVFKSIAGGPYSLAAVSFGGTNIIDSQVYNDTSYSYYLTAVDQYGDESAASDIVTVTPAASELAPVVQVTGETNNEQARESTDATPIQSRAVERLKLILENQTVRHMTARTKIGQAMFRLQNMLGSNDNDLGRPFDIFNL